MVASYPDLDGKVAVVTGGSRGIGAMTCRYLAANGVRVAAVGRDQNALDSVVEDLWSVGRAIGVAADCADPAALESLRERVIDEFGEVDILVAFAGGAGLPQSTVDMPVERWRQIIDGDLTSTFLTVQTFLPGMLARRRGSIVTMSSAAGRQPSRANAAYAAAKAGVQMLSRHLAAEVAASGVRVNCVAPAAVRNAKMMANMSMEQLSQLGDTFPLRRVGEAEDVAAATLLLASDASSWITGVTLDISGGKVIV
jgi:3-oxoacyl-[acyl-carrier protein] reductase